MGEASQDDAITSSEGVSPERFASLKRLASTDFSRFTVELQQVSEQVQLMLISQLPEFRKLAADSLGIIARAYEATLASSDEGDRALRDAFKQWRDSLERLLEDPELSIEQRLTIAREIGRTVELQAEKEAQARNFKAKLFERLTFGAAVVAGIVVVAVVGGKAGIEQGGSTGA